MKTIADVFKSAREKKSFSVRKVSQETRIKSEFIEALERLDWQHLPDFSVILGFVKNIADFLEVDQHLALALLKRDYPLKKVVVNPKPDVENKFAWTPRYTFFLGIALVIFTVFGYLGFQYYKFNTPPTLILYQPKEGSVISSSEVIVDGKTDENATVKVNNQPTVVDDEGKFETKIAVFAETKEVIVTATSRSGKEITLKRAIVVKER